MGGWANFAGALGGAVVQTTNRWIDEEMQMNKAKALAELNRSTAKNIREDDAEFSDRRAPIERKRKAEDLKASAAVTDDIEISRLGNSGLMSAREAAKDREATADRARRVAEAGDTTLQDALRGKAAEDAKAAAKTTAEVTKQQVSDSEFMAAQKALKLNDPEIAARIAASRASAASSGAHASLMGVQADSARMDIATKKRLDVLYVQAEDLLSDDKLTDAQRAAEMAKVQQKIVLVKSKNGQAAGKDPELDTQTVTEEKLNPDGTTTKTTRKEVRRPGQGSDEKAPYADGTELRGKDGKVYVVQGGKPVLKDSAKPGATPADKPRGILDQPPADSRPALSSIDTGIYAGLQPLAQEYQQARAQLQAVAKSGDSQAIQRYSQAMNDIASKLRQQAEERFGNGAARYLSTVL